MVHLNTLSAFFEASYGDDAEFEQLVGNIVSFIGSSLHEGPDKRSWNHWKDEQQAARTIAQQNYQLVRIPSNFMFHTPRLFRYAMELYQTDKAVGLRLTSALTNNRISEQGLKKLLSREWAITYYEPEDTAESYVEFFVPVRHYRYPEQE
jgi:hypothetical protein